MIPDVSTGKIFYNLVYDSCLYRVDLDLISFK